MKMTAPAAGWGVRRENIGRGRPLLGFVLAATFAAAPAALAQAPPEFVPVTDEMLQAPAPGDWLMWRRTLDGWGFRCECGLKC